MSELREVFLRVREQNIGRPDGVIADRFAGEVLDAHPALVLPALKELGHKFLGEGNRKRSKGLRLGYSVERQGVQISLPILDATFDEAGKIIVRERDHARGASDRAEYDAFALALARSNCFSRGLDPDTVIGVLRDFTDDEEIAAAWAAR